MRVQVPGRQVGMHMTKVKRRSSSEANYSSRTKGQNVWVTSPVRQDSTTAQRSQRMDVPAELRITAGQWAELGQLQLGSRWCPFTFSLASCNYNGQPNGRESLPRISARRNQRAGRRGLRAYLLVSCLGNDGWAVGEVISCCHGNWLLRTAERQGGLASFSVMRG